MNPENEISEKQPAGKVVGLGELLWDMLPDGKKFGGAPANFAFHMSQFRFDSVVVSAVGNDALGKEIIGVLDDKKLNRLVSTVDFPTGLVEVELDSKGIPNYEIKTEVAWDNIPLTPELCRLASETVAVCFGSLAQRSRTSRETINSFLDLMPSGGNIRKIFDINLRQSFYTKEIIEDSMKRCNILKINDEELVTVGQIFDLPTTDVAETAELLLARFGLEILILTCGATGSYVFTPGNSSYIETPKVKVADTVGAGDSFTASFVAALLCGNSIRDAHRLAVDVSAYVCTCDGATPKLPDRFIARAIGR